MKRVVIALAACALTASPAFAQKGDRNAAASANTQANNSGAPVNENQGFAGSTSSSPSSGVAPPTPGSDGIVFFDEDDAAMAAAIAEARRTYPQFLAAFDIAPPLRQTDYMVKVALATPDGGEEHIWVDNLRVDGDRMFGTLANEPGNLPGMRRGSPIEIDHALVSDWSIDGSEGMYGNYTTRVMLPHMNEADAAALRESLTRTPLPLDWTT